MYLFFKVYMATDVEFIWGQVCVRVSVFCVCIYHTFRFFLLFKISYDVIYGVRYSITLLSLHAHKETNGTHFSQTHMHVFTHT